MIPKSQMISIQARTTVVLAFDTDVPNTTPLKKNLELLARYGHQKDDGAPTISAEEQQQQTADAVATWIKQKS